ncbi:DUF928 domain-containing protein [Leptolyngbya sp. CCNP1308]|uniref:DUF928 domain-containing protein n=1 Tax=Leptolyngbya sp. CCNP1308 TaxID=3110255 RepID=UPI002B21B864|nr:DUF928 domain-containing protein [Leptolyngbya sp. CCNP1308]MEA5447268.1 DUF928 domain-containing protein [Leptolyngbya sp. CCNP1308]
MGTVTRSRFFLALTLMVGLAAFTASEPALAQSGNSDRGAFPGRRVGGGTRGNCAIDSRSLAALNPASNLGVTASDRPSLYFSVPTAESPYHGQFILHDADENRLYETTLVAGTEPLIGVHLPANLVNADQDYHWYFVVACNPRDLSQNVVLEGWLRRVPLTPVPADTALVETQLDLVETYQGQGLWSDAIALLVELRQAHPGNELVQAQWSRLLETLDLATVVQ